MNIRLGTFTECWFYSDGHNRHFTAGNWGKVMISAYASVFASIRVFCRCRIANLDTFPSEEIIDLPNVTFTHLLPFHGPRSYIWHRSRVLKQIREGLSDCDVCFVHIPGLVSYAGIRVARSMGIPVVCQLIGDSHQVLRYYETLLPTKPLRLIASIYALWRQRRETNMCQGQFAISRQLAQKFCYRPEAVPIIPDSRLTEDCFLPFRHRVPGEPFRALFVGRIDHLKNVQLFLYAMAMLREQGMPVNTTIVGKGEYLPALQRLANDLGISEHVKFPGYAYSRKELLEYYRRAHVFYLLSITEGLGLVLMEAGAASLPIIGSRRGGIPELAREGENAFLVEPDDVQGCGRAVRRLVEDELLREKMGRRSQEIMRPYTVNKVVAQAAEVFREL